MNLKLYLINERMVKKMSKKLIKCFTLISMVVLLAIIPIAGSTGCTTDEEGVIYLPILAPQSGTAATAYEPALGKLEPFLDYINTENPIPGVTLKTKIYDSKMNEDNEGVNGYLYLTEQENAQFIAFVDSVTIEALKARADDDHIPIFSPVGTVAATADPGYIFCIPMEFNKSVQGFLKWLDETWTGTEKARVGVVGWDMTWGRDHAAGAETYIANHPDNLVYDGAQLAPYGTTTWGSSITSELSDCDYVICGMFSSGLTGFIDEYRTAGYDGKFVLTDQNLGFWALYQASCDPADIDGLLWASNGRSWVSEPGYFGDLITDTLIPDYCTETEKSYFQNDQIASLTLCCYYYVTEVIREAVSQVDDIDDITGELIYEIAQELELSLDGYPDLSFSDTNRSLLHYTRVYEWNSSTSAFDNISGDEWINIPGFD